MAFFVQLGQDPYDQQAGQLGQATGIGLSKRLGMADAERAAATAKTENDPVKLAFALARANMAAPGLERALAPIYQSLVQQMASQGGIGQPGTKPEGEEPQKFENIVKKDIPSEERQPVDLQQLKSVYPDIPPPQQQFNPDVYGSELSPAALGMGPLPPLYTPQQISNQRLKDIGSGFPDSPKAAAMEKYNEQSRGQIQDYQRAADTHNQLAQARVRRQEQFRDELAARSGVKDQQELATMESLASTPEFEKINNDKVRADRVVKAYNTYQSAKDAFEKGSVRPRYLNRDYKVKMDSLQGLVKPFLKYGQMEQAMQILGKNGWSETEIAKIINPLSSGTTSQLNALPSLAKNLTQHIENPKETDAKFVEKQQNATDMWEKALAKLIKPGEINPRTQQVFKPGTSLVLLASEADKRGVSTMNFSLMLNDLIRDGKVNLDEFQFSELGKIQEGLGRLKSTGEYLWGE